MTNADKLQAAIQANLPNFPEFQNRAQYISGKIRGWSNANHYLFFKSWLDAFPEVKSFLIVGVYLGRDISFLLDAAGNRPLEITGVDKFNALSCDDWPEEKRGLTWEQAFNCPPPDISKASKNTSEFQRATHQLRLIQADDKQWLESANGAYDMIFLDASHEHASVARQIRAVHKLCHPHTIVSGDDYANVMPTWGVETAVKESFKGHYHLDFRIWFADAEDYI